MTVIRVLACKLRSVTLVLTIGASALVLSSSVALSQTGMQRYDDSPQWVGSSRPEPVVHQTPDTPSSVISFDTTEGTFMSMDVSPDGQSLVFDLLGDIYSLPFAGGEAVSLTSGRAWDQAPRFSPDGAHVYFVSDREGYKNIWRLTLADESLQQVTQSHFDILGAPNWSQDGTRLIVGVDDAEPASGESVLYAIDPGNGAMTQLERPDGPWLDLNTITQLRDQIHTYTGVQTADDQVYFGEARFGQNVGGTVVKLYSFDPDTETRVTVTQPGASYSEYKPQLSHDGCLLAYFRQYPDRRTEIRMRNLTTGQDEALIELTNADDASYNADDDSRPNYAFTPDDRSVVFWHAGKIHRVSLTDGSSEIVPFRVSVEREVKARARPSVQHISETGEASVIRWPSLSPDGQTMAFAAIGYVWVMDLETGHFRRLTDSSDFEYMPALSPNGKSIAYVSFAQTDNGYGSGRLMVADVDGGTPQELLAGPSETYLIPKWSCDGQKIAVIREVQTDGNDEAAFGWTPAASGEFHVVAPAPASNKVLSWNVYSRSVGFDTTGRKLLFSFPRSRHETVLAAASLDGGSSRTLAVGDADIGGITPAPDLKNLALTRRDGTVWVMPFDAGFEQSRVSTSSPDARRVSDNGGYYVDWNGPRRITFAFGQNVYRYQLDDSGPELLRVRLSFEKPKAAQPIAFTGARLITMSNANGPGRVIESGTIVVDGQRIAAIGPADDVVIPPDAAVIDAAGKTIMPGLLDTHYHRIGGWSLSAFALPNPDFSDQSAIEYGIATAWEPGGAVDDGVPATADLQRAGRIAGPRWSHAVEARVGYPWELLTNYAAAAAAVDRHRDLGVAVLKEVNTPTRQQRQWLSAAAREKGLGIVSHIVTFDGMMTRIVDGYTGGDHPYIPAPFFKDVRELLKQTGYIWTPNIAITSGTVGIPGDKRGYYCRAVLEWRNRTGRGNGERSSICVPDQTIPTVAYDIHRVGRVARQVASAASNGIHIGVSAHNMPGSSLYREMWYLWKGGLPIEDVLRATTIGNAEKLGLQEEIGSLEAGKIADLLVLDENPLEDILNTLSLKYTVQGGVVYDSETTQRVDLSSIQE